MEIAYIETLTTVTFTVIWVINVVERGRVIQTELIFQLIVKGV
jgi:hypothetical protein